MNNLISFKNIFLVLFLIAGLMISCKEEVQPLDNDNEADSLNVENNTDNSMMFKLPSPVELYIFLWEDDVKFDATLLNSTEAAGNYVTTYKKAINFGIYSSDLAYCTVYGKNQQTFNYFTTAKQIADDIGLMEGFDETFAKKIDENINNADSLYKFSTESYSVAITYLENIEQDNLLPFIITGAWLESLYIAINSIGEFSFENPTIMRVAEQQMLLENLIDYFITLPKDEQINELYNSLLDIQDSYDKLYDNVEEIMTEEQFNEILNKVNKVRNNIVS